MPERPVLILSNTLDFATDYVVAELRRREAPYVRLNLDTLSEDQISLDPLTAALDIVQLDGKTLSIRDPLSVLYRAPTHLRESSGHRYDPKDLLARHQWTAFARSLTVFTRAKWVNHPRDTFLAENKPFQLALAREVGFSVPETRVTNAPALIQAQGIGSSTWAVKSLDSFLLRVNDRDAFFYTQCLTMEELCRESLNAMPVIAQQWLDPKVDVRVTVVGQKCFAASVTADQGGIHGDWRLLKDKAIFTKLELPDEITDKCRSFLDRLHLTFGAIDFAMVDDQWYFLEINPTGEWAWLVERAQLPIDVAIVDELLST